MDCSNGNIGLMDELIESGSKKEDLIPIRMADATSKQRKRGRVSLHDRRSPLGKQLTSARARNCRKGFQKRLKESRRTQAVGAGCCN